MKTATYNPSPLEVDFANALVILQKENADTLFIDTWLMSCRVLKRSMENFTLNCIAGFARDNDIRFLKGEYIVTEKNGMVANHYQNLGFEHADGYWLMDVQQYLNKKSFIRKK